MEDKTFDFLSVNRVGGALGPHESTYTPESVAASKSISLYSSENEDYLPPIKLPVTDQLSRVQSGTYKGWRANHLSCVGHSLAYVMSILMLKATGNAPRYSYQWIYGNRNASDDQNEGMQYNEALSHLKAEGVVSYETCPNDAFYNSNVDKAYIYDASGNHPTVQSQAKTSTLLNDTGASSGGEEETGEFVYMGDGYITAKMAVETLKANGITSGTKIQSYSTLTTAQQVKTAIKTYGAVLASIAGTNALDSDHLQLAPDHELQMIAPDGYLNEKVWGHSLCIYGYRYINGNLYWLAQNSWGAGYGGLYTLFEDWEGTVFIPDGAQYIQQFYQVIYSSSVGEFPTLSEVSGERIEGGGIFSHSTDMDGMRRFCLKSPLYSKSDWMEEGDETITMQNLKYAHTYEVYVILQREDGIKLTSPKSEFTVAPKTPEEEDVSIISKTQEGVTLRFVNQFTNGESDFSSFVYWYRNIGDEQYTQGEAVIGNESWIDIFIPTNSGAIEIKIRGRFQKADGTIVDSVGFLELTLSGEKPEDFNWSTAEADAIQNGGSFNTITQDRWNELVDHCKAVLIYMGEGESTTQGTAGDLVLTQSTTYLELVDMARSVGNKTLTSKMYNALALCSNYLNAIYLEANYNNIIHYVMKGDPVDGGAFYWLPEVFNAVKNLSS